MVADYYELLGVAPTASSGEIRKAYLRLAREKHPDRFSEGPEKDAASAVFQDLTTAFNTLCNERSRREYDETRSRPQPTTPEDIARDAFERSSPLLKRGALDEAVTLQSQLLAQAESMDRPGLEVARLRANLELYQKRQPSRLPPA